MDASRCQSTRTSFRVIVRGESGERGDAGIGVIGTKHFTTSAGLNTPLHSISYMSICINPLGNHLLLSKTIRQLKLHKWSYVPRDERPLESLRRSKVRCSWWRQMHRDEARQQPAAASSTNSSSSSSTSSLHFGIFSPHSTPESRAASGDTKSIEILHCS